MGNASAQQPARAGGSVVSTKQIERAARERTLVRFDTGLAEPVRGYIVGQDDYHWFVATITSKSEVETVLVHKGSTPVVRFTSTSLDQEPETAAKAISKIGDAYWSFLNKRS